MNAAPASPSIRYFNVVDPINADYAELRAALRRKDLRVFCLLDFEMTLSYMLTKPIAQHKEYRDIRERIPLDDMDPYAVLDYRTFRWVMTQYELIMRENRLIGGQAKRQAVGYAARYFGGDDDVQE